MSEDEGGPEPGTVVAPAGGGRLDRVLAEGLGISRARVRRLLARGAVRRDGRPLGLADKGTPLEAGDVLAVQGAARADEERIRPGEVPGLELLGEGPGWLGYDKPAGVAVHPFAPEETGTVLGDAVRRRPALQGVGEGGLRSGVVHRLDVETSGVQLVASDEPTWVRLRAAFAQHRMDKRYHALVEGDFAGDLELSCVLAVTRHRPARVSVRPDAAEGRDGARRVEQRVRALERFGDATLVEVRPRSGYLHQIRATLSHLGHPVVGDATYGSSRSAPRQLLHAAFLAGEGIELTAPDPEDLRDALASLGSAEERPLGG